MPVSLAKDIIMIVSYRQMNLLDGYRSTTHYYGSDRRFIGVWTKILDSVCADYTVTILPAETVAMMETERDWSTFGEDAKTRAELGYVKIPCEVGGCFHNARTVIVKDHRRMMVCARCAFDGVYMFGWVESTRSIYDHIKWSRIEDGISDELRIVSGMVSRATVLNYF